METLNDLLLTDILEIGMAEARVLIEAALKIRRERQARHEASELEHADFDV